MVRARFERAGTLNAAWTREKKSPCPAPSFLGSRKSGEPMPFGSGGAFVDESKSAAEFEAWKDLEHQPPIKPNANKTTIHTIRRPTEFPRPVFISN